MARPAGSPAQGDPTGSAPPPTRLRDANDDVIDKPVTAVGGDENPQFQRLTAALDSMLDPFIQLDAVRDETGALIDLRYAEANDAALTYNQLTRDQMIGKQLLDLFPGQLEHGPLRLYFRTIETGEPTVLEDYAYEHELLGKERRYDIVATRSGDGIALIWRDVTDRYRAAEALSRSEERYKLLAENSSDVICMSMDNRTFSWVSDSAEKVLGYPAHDLIGTSALDFIHPDDIPELVNVVALSNETGQTARPRSRWRRPDGEYIWIEIAGRPFVDATGRAGRVVSIHVVDEQVCAEKQLAASEAMYRLLAENSSDVIVLSGPDTVATWISPSIERMLGWPPQDLIGRPGMEYLHPDDLDAVRTRMAAAATTGDAVRVRVRFRQADGTYRWVEIIDQMVPNAPRDPEQRVARMRDIDEQVRAEQALIDSEQRYRLMAENSSDVVMLVDDRGRLVWVSASAAQTLGWDSADLIGHHSNEYIHPDDLGSLLDDVARSNQTGQRIRARYRWRRADGTYRWMEAAGNPIADDGSGRPGRVVALRDIDDEVRAQASLSDSERLFRLLAQNSTDVVMLADSTGQALWVSPSVERALGWTPDEVIGRRGADFLHPDDIPAMRDALEASTTTGQDARLRYRMRASNGDYHWFEAVGHTLPTDDDQPRRRAVRLRDIDEQVRAEHDLAEREERFRVLAENASDVVWQVAEDGTIIWVSPSVARVLGWTPEEILGRVALELANPDDRDRLVDMRRDVLSGRTMQGEFRFATSAGSFRWVALTMRPVMTADGPTRVSTLRDIQDEVEARSRLDFALRHDQSTGLPTRAAVADYLRDELMRATDPRGIAVLTIGIDLLKDVNDAYGHSAGDVVVATVASRVVEAVGRSHVVGRGTGDEFMAVLTHVLDPAEAAAIAERVRIGVHGELGVADRTVAPTVSIGIAMGRTDGSAEALQQEATLALHRAKELGRDRWAFADADLARTAARRMALESAIREGLDHREFQPWFQPIVSLADDMIVGYEALVRWQHLDQVMDPSQFLDVALRTPMIAEIDLAMVEPVVAALAARPELAFIAVNVTGLTLARSDYASYVSACLARHDVAPSRLHVEITETMLLGLDVSVVAQITTLADMGVHWYVDDFGTGYSSISHLRDLPVRGLKLDASFTAGIGAGSHTARQLAVALLGLANGLGLDTVAEGVETQAEEDYLRTLGWRHGQGWLYGKAAPLPLH